MSAFLLPDSFTPSKGHSVALNAFAHRRSIAYLLALVPLVSLISILILILLRALLLVLLHYRCKLSALLNGRVALPHLGGSSLSPYVIRLLYLENSLA